MQDAWAKKFFMSRGFLIGALIIAALFAVGYGRAYYRDLTIRREIERLQRHVTELENKKLQSLEFLSKVKSDQFAEEAARLQLGLVKPGEKAVVVTSSATAGAVTTTPTSVVFEPSMSIPKKWWYYFFNKNRLYAR